MAGKQKPGCPICRKAEAEAYKPFCSKRCADLDLGQWLGEGYQLPGHEPADPDEVIAILEKRGQFQE